MPGPLRIAVVGAGAFGRNHLRVLRDLQNHHAPDGDDLTPSVELAAVVDVDPGLRATAEATYNLPAFASVNDLLAAGLNLHAATVAAPTLSHARITSHLLEAGLDVLVEKPLTATLEEADHLIALAARNGRILAAGHLERFNPAVTAALAQLTRPMFFEAHRLSIFTPRSLDVDVVLDLMIHDLDILLTMARSPVTEVRAVGLPILSGKVDIANVRLQFASGAVANLTASRVSTEQVRKLRLFQPAEYLSLDYARQELLTIQVQRPEALGSIGSVNPGSQGEAAGPKQHPSAGLSFHQQTPPRAEPLRLELQDFLRAVAHRTPPRVTGQDARAALALALDINSAIQQHSTQVNLSAAAANL